MSVVPAFRKPSGVQSTAVNGSFFWNSTTKSSALFPLRLKAAWVPVLNLKGCVSVFVTMIFQLSPFSVN